MFSGDVNRTPSQQSILDQGTSIIGKATAAGGEEALVSLFFVAFNRTPTIYVIFQSLGFYNVVRVLIVDARSFQAFATILDWLTHLALISYWYRSDARQDEVRLCQSAFFIFTTLNNPRVTHSKVKVKRNKLFKPKFKRKTTISITKEKSLSPMGS